MLSGTSVRDSFASGATSRAVNEKNASDRLKDLLPTRLRKHLGFLRNPAPSIQWWIFYRQLRLQNEINVEFDRKHGVDTAWEIGLSEAGIDHSDIDRCNGIYRGIWADVFHGIMGELSIDFRDFSFIDFGSGKGKALFLASSYPFREIHGVEFSPLLHEIAVRNRERYQNPKQRCEHLHPALGDAMQYAVPEQTPLICFFFNPFDAATTKAVLQNLHASWLRNKRDIFIIYVNLRSVAENLDAFRGFDWLRRERRTTKYVVFRIDAAARTAAPLRPFLANQTPLAKPENGKHPASNPEKALMIAFDGGRWGAARLIKPLSEAGFRVAVLSPKENSAAHTRYLTEFFPLNDVSSSTKFETRLLEVIRAFKPSLIIPADERAVACLHYLSREAREGRGRLDKSAMELIQLSLGDPEYYDAALLKSETHRLAAGLGLRAPTSVTAGSAEQAIQAARQMGLPVFVKKSFSWSGAGVSFCQSVLEVSAAYHVARDRKRRPFRQTARRLLHRDWYPSDADIDIQKSIEGTPAMFCAVALRGKMLAGFAGITRQTTAPNAPSSVVWIGAHEEMERISTALIGKLGATGFINFDFMIEASTGDAFLLECNPRPIPISHLGSRVGVDLCSALMLALQGFQKPATTASRDEVITLFPNEWQRNPAGLLTTGNHIDMPYDDPKLLQLMIGNCWSTAAGNAA